MAATPPPMSPSLASAMMKSPREYLPARILASFWSRRFMTILSEAPVAGRGSIADGRGAAPGKPPASAGGIRFDAYHGHFHVLGPQGGDRLLRRAVVGDDLVDLGDLGKAAEGRGPEFRTVGEQDRASCR